MLITKEEAWAGAQTRASSSLPGRRVLGKRSQVECFPSPSQAR